MSHWYTSENRRLRLRNVTKRWFNLETRTNTQQPDVTSRPRRSAAVRQPRSGADVLLCRASRPQTVRRGLRRLWLQKCEFLNWVVSPSLICFCHRSSSSPLWISPHSLTAWTLCCAYCSVTSSPGGPLHPDQLFRCWPRCRSRIYFSSNLDFYRSFGILSTRCRCVQSGICWLQVRKYTLKMFMAGRTTNKHEAVDFIEWQENQRASGFSQTNVGNVDGGGEPF